MLRTPNLPFLESFSWLAASINSRIRWYEVSTYTSILKRRISAWNVELDVRVRRARALISSLEQSREIRTSSQRAPPLIMSFALVSAITVKRKVASVQKTKEETTLFWNKKDYIFLGLDKYHVVPGDKVLIQRDVLSVMLRCWHFALSTAKLHLLSEETGLLLCLSRNIVL